jgi:F-type H+-transporting ATPase subunit b
MIRFTTLFLAFSAGPALAASGPFFSLRNTNFVVLLAFLLFVAMLVYLKVPQRLAGMLDKRAQQIKAELEEARSIREEAQAALAAQERKLKEVSSEAERLIAHAREEAELAAAQAKKELQETLKRRLQAAEEQIASAQAAALKEVRNRAVDVAIAAARDVIAAQMTAQQANKLIDEAIETVEKRLH